MAVLLYHTYNNQDGKDYTENKVTSTDTSITYAVADYGYNAVFNAVGDGIAHGTFTGLNGLTQVSFYMRIKFQSTVGAKGVCFKNGQYSATYDGTTFTFNITGSTGTASVSATLGTTDYYQIHVIYKHDGVANDMSIYVDGTLVTSTSTVGALVSNSNVGYVGGDSGNGILDTANFLMNEYKVFSQALTAIQRTSHINEPNGVLAETNGHSFALFDIIRNEVSGYAIVTLIDGNDYRFQPITANSVLSNKFKRVGNLYTTSRQSLVNLKSDGLYMYDGISLSSEVLATSKLVFKSTITSNTIYDYGSLTTGLDNYDIPANNIITFNAGATASITGIVAPSYPRRIVIINRSSTNTIRLYDESGSSTAANRFDLTADYDIPINKSVEIIYDTNVSRWRIIKE